MSINDTYACQKVSSNVLKTWQYDATKSLLKVVVEEAAGAVVAVVEVNNSTGIVLTF